MEYGILTLTFCLSITVYAQKTGELNDKCRTVAECRSFGYICARNKTCQCYPFNYVPSKDRNTCLGTVDQKCKYDEHCVEGAYCQNQSHCKCKDEFYADQEGFCSHSSSVKAYEYFVLPILLLYCLRLYI